MKILVYLENDVLKMPAEDANLIEAIKKINAWIENGATVEFLTEINKFLELKALDDKLKACGLPNPKIHSLQEGEDAQKVIAEQIKPNVFIGNASNAGPEAFDQGVNVACIAQSGCCDLAKLPDRIDDLKELGKKEEKVEEAE